MTWSRLAWCCIQHCGDWCRTDMKHLISEKTHPILPSLVNYSVSIARFWRNWPHYIGTTLYCASSCKAPYSHNQISVLQTFRLLWFLIQTALWNIEEFPRPGIVWVRASSFIYDTSMVWCKRDINSSSLAMDLHLFCITPLIWRWKTFQVIGPAQWNT